jgi:hypothetical protein
MFKADNAGWRGFGSNPIRDGEDFPDPCVTRRFSTPGTARSFLLGLGKILTRRYCLISK